jgi:FtsZ-binding cell division protein ZapB
MNKKKANKKILKAVEKIQKIYLIIDEIKNKNEKKIIHYLFQDLSDKLLDNI